MQRRRVEERLLIGEFTDERILLLLRSVNSRQRRRLAGEVNLGASLLLRSRPTTAPPYKIFPVITTTMAGWGCTPPPPLNLYRQPKTRAFVRVGFLLCLPGRGWWVVVAGERERE